MTRRKKKSLKKEEKTAQSFNGRIFTLILGFLYSLVNNFYGLLQNWHHQQIGMLAICIELVYLLLTRTSGA